MRDKGALFHNQHHDWPEVPYTYCTPLYGYSDVIVCHLVHVYSEGRTNQTVFTSYSSWPEMSLSFESIRWHDYEAQMIMIVYCISDVCQVNMLYPNLNYCCFEIQIIIIIQSYFDIRNTMSDFLLNSCAWKRSSRQKVKWQRRTVLYR